jgi:hypothetical protein
MRRLAIILGSLSAALTCVQSLGRAEGPAGVPGTDHGVRSMPTAMQTAKARIDPHYGRLPLSFELNAGQTVRRVDFLARGRRHTIFLTGGDAVLALRGGPADDEDDSGSDSVVLGQVARSPRDDYTVPVSSLCV